MSSSFRWNDPLCTASFLVVLLIYFVMLPTILYWVYQFFRVLRFDLRCPGVKNRRPKFIFLQLICNTIVLFFRPFDLRLGLGMGEVVPPYIGTAIANGPLNLVAGLLAIRYWVVGYDVLYYEAMAKNEWKHMINPSAEPSKYITNRKKWGSTRWLTYRFLIFWAITLAIISALKGFFPETSYYAVVEVLIMIACVVFANRNLSRVNTSTDRIFLRQEIKIQSWISIIAIVLACCCIPLLFISRRAWMFAASMVGVLALFAWTLGSTWWLLRVLRPFDYDNEPSMSRQASQSTVVLFNAATANMSPTAPTPRKPSSLVLCIQDKQGFALFMAFLISEFGAESLLFFTEFLQYRSHLKSIHSDPTADDFDIDLHKSVPKSPLLQMESDNEKAIYLYTKYVDNAKAQFEINVSHRTRVTVKEKIERLQNDESSSDINTITIFDESATEIYVLLRHSYSRCRRTTEWEEWFSGWKSERRGTLGLRMFSSASSIRKERSPEPTSPVNREELTQTLNFIQMASASISACSTPQPQDQDQDDGRVP